jgi:hypothetical protein
MVTSSFTRGTWHATGTPDFGESIARGVKMEPRAAAKRLETLEIRVDRLEELPARIEDVTQQVLQLRTEMGAEFSAVRAEMNAQWVGVRTELNELRTELHDLRTETRSGFADVHTQMRILHEDVIARIAILHEASSASKSRQDTKGSARRKKPS